MLLTFFASLRVAIEIESSNEDEYCNITDQKISGKLLTNAKHDVSMYMPLSENSLSDSLIKRLNDEYSPENDENTEKKPLCIRLTKVDFVINEIA